MKTKNSKTNSKRGRPAYNLVFPPKVRYFTMGDLFLMNGVDVETGKGELCSALTVRAAVNRLIKAKMLEKVEDKLAAPHGEGKGRKQFVFRRLANADIPKPTASAKPARKAKVVPAVAIKPLGITNTAEYEAAKASMGIPPTPTEQPEQPVETAAAETPVAA